MGPKKSHLTTHRVHLLEIRRSKSNAVGCLDSGRNRFSSKELCISNYLLCEFSTGFQQPLFYRHLILNDFNGLDHLSHIIRSLCKFLGSCKYKGGLLGEIIEQLGCVIGHSSKLNKCSNHAILIGILKNSFSLARDKNKQGRDFMCQ